MSLVHLASPGICLLGLLCLAASPPVVVAQLPHPHPVLPEVWKDFKDQVRCLTLSPDGNSVVVHTGTILFFDRKTGKEMKRLPTPEYFPSHYDLFTFTPDGKYLVTTRSLQGVFVWEVKSSRLVRQFRLAPGQGAYSYYLCHQFGVGNKVLVVGGGPNEVATVYDLETGKALGNFPGKQRVQCLALSTDGNWLLTADVDKKLCIWDVQKRALLHELYEHSEEVMAVAISADGRWCASLAEDRLLRVFDGQRGEFRKRAHTMLKHFFKGVSWLLFTPDGQTVVATGYGHRHGMAVWDWQSSQENRGGIPTPEPKFPAWRTGATHTISRAILASDGRTLLTAGPGAFRIWDLKPPVSPAAPDPPAPSSPPGC